MAQEERRDAQPLERPSPRGAENPRQKPAHPAQPDRALIAALARKHGFVACGIASAQADDRRSARLEAWLQAGFAGEMDWMAREVEKRAQPQALWPEARSIILLGSTYAPDQDPQSGLAEQKAGHLALYAIRPDYHDVIKARLKAFARDLIQSAQLAKTPAEVKVFVDTAPVMEKPLAAASGLGWQGKNTMLVSRQHGNWLLLGAIYTNLALEADRPEADHCGSCRRCLDICPTGAFPAPYQLDSRACIAYLTIEHKGPIDRDLRAKFGNRVFGCDDCLAICPWNKFAVAARDAQLGARAALQGRPLAELARLDDAQFRALFAKTPIKRTGRARFLRNVLIAIGNSGDTALIPSAHACLADSSPLVRGMAVWALSCLMQGRDFLALADEQAWRETDETVRAEWQAARDGASAQGLAGGSSCD